MAISLFCIFVNKTPLNNIFIKINDYNKKNSAFTFEITPVVSNYMIYVFIVVSSFLKRVEV